jgi:ribosomal protein S12 methylthiotransferase accessory factor
MRAVATASSPGICLFGDQPLRAPKLHRDGTHRTRAPGVTLAKMRPLMKRLGITRLARLTGLDTVGVPVWTAIRPNGRSLSTSQGKGLSDDAAAVSALMESIETWHAERIDRPVVRGAWRTLRKRLPLVDPRQLPAERHLRAERTAVLDARLEWIEGWDLVAGAPRWVPREAVTLDCVMPATHVPRFARSSNGLASGNHVLEALAHALCEVIERDAEARWRHRRGQRRVDLSTVRDPHCRTLLDRIAAAHVHTIVWDITSDVGVPAFGAAIMENPHEPAWRALGLYQGFGCHLDPAVALARALSEAIQTRVTYISGSRDDFFPHDYARTTDEELLTAIWDEVTTTPGERVDFATLPPSAAADSFEGDVRTLLARLVAAKVKQVVAVDLSRPELGVPVVKVLVPGRANRVELMG